MLSTARSRGLEKALTSTPTASLPSFLLPAFPLTPVRQFSSSPYRASQIGRAPLSIPPGVTLEVLPQTVKKSGGPIGAPLANIVKVEGPLGSMQMIIQPFVKLDYDIEGRKAFVTVENNKLKQHREMWGTTRAYLQNHILGVSEGHTAILRLVGVGYRATIENSATTVSPEFEGQQFVVLKIGYSHPIEMPVPKGVKASTPQTARILLEGVEKEVILQFAAKIRKWRRPEPYKGKGIFVNGEKIKLKAKKIK
ncbi:mitochondrial 54S ribosomal protein YmL16 [Amylocarpus encephaloides]|uniref:Mitochondrial 54S ribosomal protein YmL16 n=1 Tax=Amylocarpus encephaloides TaxID=45428 RepID=A0A9P7YSJ7_9HELO|nr:mitochondrial 54S ribosomal protein YmL16 [Amylocarpus encephaloides]